MHGRRRVLYLVSACLLLLSMGWSSASAAPPANAGKTITVAMDGASERPGPGDPDGSGTAVFVLNPGQGTICYTLTVSGIAPATAAHIHVAPSTSPGPVVVGLTAPTDGSSEGCANAGKETVRAILLHPENYYVNVHNAEFGPGAIRGQLG